MSDQWTSAQVNDDWMRARRQAIWEAVFDVVARRPSELLPLDEVRSRLNVRGSAYRGLQHVPLEKIVGSEGRYADFDRRFLPRRDSTADRWRNIDRAQYQSVTLPPVELYKIGDIYFVKDGNHRVSVGRQRGQKDIDAYVTEYEVDVPLDPSISMRDLLIKEEYSDFLDWTGLARLRPEQRIELSALGGYLELVNHINTHRYYLSVERGGPIEAEDAVASWYDNVYRPVVDAIRQHGILRYFPGRTEADLYLWIMQHRKMLHESEGGDPGAEAATLDYASRYGRRSWLGAVAEAAQAISTAANQLVSSASSLVTARPQSPSVEFLDFIEWSHLDRACPETDIRLSNPRDYQRLRAHLEEHHTNLARYLGHDVPLEDAVRDWCENFYGRTVQAIRQHNLLRDRPGQTEADLYLAAVDHLRSVKGHDAPAGATEAIRTLKQPTPEGRAAGSPLQSLVQSARRLLRRRR